MSSIEFGGKGPFNYPHPPLRDLFIAEEQPGEASATALEYLNANPEVRAFIERQKALERMTDRTNFQLDLLLPDFDLTSNEDGESDLGPPTLR